MPTSILPRRAFSVASVLLAALLALAARPLSAKTLGWNADALSVGLAKAGKLPPAPAGVTDIAFSEFYKSPVGPQGLEFTDKVRALAGQRVRLLGFMVRQGIPAPGVMILAPYAMTTSEGDFGLCDDFPPSVVFVPVPKYADIAVPFRRGPLLLTGRLELGPHEEPDGRISHIRLLLDPEPAAAPVQAASATVVATADTPASATR